MRFTLTYRGPLKAASGSNLSKHKHDIRKQLDPQLQRLFEFPPLSTRKDKLLDPDRHPDRAPGGNSLIVKRRDIEDQLFACIVSSKLHTVAELDIMMMRPEEPGRITQAGDIDNRIKTLLDALKVPEQRNALPNDFVAKDDGELFFCLLEDDALVTKLSIDTDRWLDPKALERSEVWLTIKVTTRVTTQTMENFDF